MAGCIFIEHIILPRTTLLHSGAGPTSRDFGNVQTKNARALSLRQWPPYVDVLPSTSRFARKAAARKLVLQMTMSLETDSEKQASSDSLGL